MYNSQAEAHPTLSVPYLSLREPDIAKSKYNCVWLIRCAHAFVLFIVAVALASRRHMGAIVVGGRHCWLFVLAGGPPYIYHLYTLCIYGTIHIFSGPPSMSKTHPPTTMMGAAAPRRHKAPQLGLGYGYYKSHYSGKYLMLSKKRACTYGRMKCACTNGCILAGKLVSSRP